MFTKLVFFHFLLLSCIVLGLIFHFGYDMFFVNFLSFSFFSSQIREKKSWENNFFFLMNFYNFWIDLYMCGFCVCTVSVLQEKKVTTKIVFSNCQEDID